jgi:multidrug resistance efflux pump
MIARGLKLFAGVGAVGFGMWAMAGSFASSEGAPAIVSGQTTIIRASQDGYAMLDALRRGSAVHKGEAIGTLLLSPTGENKSMTLVQTKGRVDAIRSEIATLQGQIRELQERTEKNRTARIDELNSKMAEATANIEAAHAKEAAATAVLDRQQKLYSIGWTVKSSVEAAKHTADAARMDRTAAEKQISTHQLQLSAARDGTFLQDAYNDAAYSQQRADQLRLRVDDLQAESQQQKQLLSLLEDDAQQMKMNASDRNAVSKQKVSIVSPVAGIAWSVTNNGQYVRAGDEIARIIDCSQLSANATVSPLEYASIKDGDRASFRQTDQRQPWKGTVTWAGVPESSESAAPIPAALGSNNAQYSVSVALDDVSNASDCPAGKFGRVVFENTQALSGWRMPGLQRLASMVGALHLR